jgi:ABC-type Mn2+/Zn2+ transport system permease subunit
MVLFSAASSGFKVSKNGSLKINWSQFFSIRKIKVIYFKNKRNLEVFELLFGEASVIIYTGASVTWVTPTILQILLSKSFLYLDVDFKIRH